MTTPVEALPPPALRVGHADALVFFGATGDLAYRKIFPALHNMVRGGTLDVPVVAVVRADWTRARLLEHARASVAEHGGGVDAAAFARFAQLLGCVQGDYADAATFDQLRGALVGAHNPMHYLAIPPRLFGAVVDAIGRSGCADGARVVVEKPFGHDRASAGALNQRLHAVFSEPRIYRIDHYLGKEAVENLLYFRFANAFFEPIWDSRHVQSVQVTMAEELGVAGRGEFYDQTGAVRDVVQNHLLQVVGLLAMEPPRTISGRNLHDEHVKVLRAIRPLDPSRLVRGQVQGYRDEAGVAATSTTETFAAVRLTIDSERWRGVPFVIRTGKQLPTTATEVMVRFKPAPLSRLAPGEANYVRFRLGPDIAIGLGARVKQPGRPGQTMPVELSVVGRPRADEVDAYERLLTDAMAGEDLLFVREDAVDASWAIVDPILGSAAPAHPYRVGTWGPPEADRLVSDLGGWNTPS
jgi:glucose-6-phosphate 1-dehydrogenase